MAVVSVPAVFLSAASMYSVNGADTAPELKHVLHLSNRILCGSEPRGPSAFETLKKLEVKTIVSVDGAAPQLSLAKAADLRYVHIPVGYDGISSEAGHSLTRVVRETEGRIYIHCHHGQHRGPAAAAIACQVERTADRQRALQIMLRAGTSREYAGLYRDVSEFVVPDKRAQLPPLVEVAQLESFTITMSRVSRRLEALKESTAAELSSTAARDCQSSARDALLLHEALHEAVRNLSSEHDRSFRIRLIQSGAAAKAVYESLQSGVDEAVRPQIQVLQRTCTQCHKVYRD